MVSEPAGLVETSANEITLLTPLFTAFENWLAGQGSRLAKAPGNSVLAPTLAFPATLS